MKPDRVVIGIEADDTRAADLMRELYGPFTRTGAPILMMDSLSAELSKYAAIGVSGRRSCFPASATAGAALRRTSRRC